MTGVKTIAFYLPQYHETEENNKWWGEGFTEWTGVRKAKPLYPGHYQPREPLNDNYYDLTNPDTLKWQAKLAREYDIYGFCIYHYWFGDKQLLQKPAEMLLENRDIDINYCFSWANESWIRTWSALEGNNWNADEDLRMSHKGPSVLAEQKYGLKEDWKRHFLYLLPFFQDERYIYIDEKPVFVIYIPEKIKCLHSMLKYWNELALESGLKGIYFISTNNIKIQDKNLNANLIFEPKLYWKDGPMSFWDKYKGMLMKRKGVRKMHVFSYKKFWRYILQREYKGDRKTYLGGMVGFDKTPREQDRATLFRRSTPYLFKKYYKQLVKNSMTAGNDILFINAWNEWGEGAYLEPDKKNKYQYLEAIKSVNEEIGK